MESNWEKGGVRSSPSLQCLQYWGCCIGQTAAAWLVGELPWVGVDLARKLWEQLAIETVEREFSHAELEVRGLQWMDPNSRLPHLKSIIDQQNNLIYLRYQRVCDWCHPLEGRGIWGVIPRRMEDRVQGWRSSGPTALLPTLRPHERECAGNRSDRVCRLIALHLGNQTNPVNRTMLRNFWGQSQELGVSVTKRASITWRRGYKSGLNA